MGQLRGADAARLLEFTADAQALEDPEPFTMDLLARLVDLTDSDCATYNEFEDASRRAFRYQVDWDVEHQEGEPPPELDWDRSITVSEFARTHGGDVFVGLTNSIDIRGCGSRRFRGRRSSGLSTRSTYGCGLA